MRVLTQYNEQVLSNSNLGGNNKLTKCLLEVNARRFYDVDVYEFLKGVLSIRDVMSNNRRING